MLRLQSFTVGPFAENPYLVVCSETGAAALVDPGDEPDLLWQAVQDAKATVTAILLTHAHLDHVGAVEELRRRAAAPVYLHAADDALLAAVEAQGRLFGLAAAPVAPADHALHHGDRLQIGALTVEVLHTPGHTP